MAAIGFGRMARYAAAGVEFSTMPVAGAVAGHYLDLHFGTDPMLTVVLCLAGFVAGIVHLARELSDLQRGP